MRSKAGESTAKIYQRYQTSLGEGVNDGIVKITSDCLYKLIKLEKI